MKSESGKIVVTLIVVLVAMVIWDGFLKAVIFPET
jgi:hypothetical protein